jgi:hypothetical protein
MEVTIPYQSLTHTLKCLKLQVIDSLPYISNYIDASTIHTPRQAFNAIKKRVTYKNDPQGVEYIQTVQTIERNGGLCDCDCMTVYGLTALTYLDIKPLYVVLVGNNKYNPSHIYIEVWDNELKKIVPFDLTNPVYNLARNYKYKQRLKFKL